MAVKLNIGLSRKVGQPNFGSRQASIGLEVELDAALLAAPEALQEKVQLLYRFADTAVESELGRADPGLATSAPVEPVAVMGLPVKLKPERAAPRESVVASNRSAGVDTGATAEQADRLTSERSAVPGLTPNQLRAIYALGRRLRLNPLRLARERFKVEHVDDLDIKQASRLIAELKASLEPQ
jgi:hypothetical protein